MAGTRRLRRTGRTRQNQSGIQGSTYAWAGDEHGRLDMRHVSRRLKVGDRVECGAPHCDPTVNLYDEIHALRGDEVEAVWPIAARGKSQ